MSYEIAFICDYNVDKNCYLYTKLYPSAIAHTATAAVSQIQLLRANAIDNGWRRGKQGWACPSCATGLLTSEKQRRLRLISE